MTPFRKVIPTLLLTLATLTSTVVCQDRARTNIFSSDPIHVEDYGAPPATSTILLYDCTGTHRPKPDSPGSFQVFHNNEWWTQLCQEGLFWNQSLCRCEYPAGKRPERECRDYRATSTEPTGKYEQYVNNNWIIRDCSLAVAGLVWDQDSCQCVWGPRSKEMVTGQGVTPCDIMLNLTFEDGTKDTAKNSFVEVGRGPLVPIFTLDPQDAVDGTKAAFFSETALNVWYFAGNELGTSLRVEFRFKMTNDPSNRDKYQIFISNGCNISNPGYTTPSLAIGYRPADQSYLLAFETASARKAIVCSKRLGAYTWHTVSLIYEDGTLLLRVDDQPCIISQDFTGPIQKTPCPLTIGADPLERQSMYKGYLDNLLIARYCRRFIDSDPAENEKKGPMPVESVGPLADDFSDPSPPLGKGPNDVRRSVTNSKYIQVVGDNGVENSKKNTPLRSASDVSLRKAVPGSSKTSSDVRHHANVNKGSEKTAESGISKSSKPIGQESSTNNKVHIASGTVGIHNSGSISKHASDSGKSFISSNTDYFVRGKQPAGSEKNNGYTDTDNSDTGANSQSYFHKATGGNGNGEQYDAIERGYASGKQKTDRNNYNPSKSQGNQYEEDATISGKFNRDKSYGQSIQSSQNSKEGQGVINTDRSYDEGAANNYDGHVEVQDRVSGLSKDSFVDNQGAEEYEEIDDGENTHLAKDISWKDSGAESSTNDNYDAIEDSRKDDTLKQEGGIVKHGGNLGNFYDENIRSHQENKFEKGNGQNADEEDTFRKSNGQNAGNGKIQNNDYESKEGNKHQQNGNQLKNEDVGGTFQSNVGNDATSGYHKSLSGSSEGGYSKQTDMGYNVNQKQSLGSGQAKSNKGGNGAEYNENESMVSQVITSQQQLHKTLNEFDGGRSGQKTKEIIDTAENEEESQTSKQTSADNNQNYNNQNIFHKSLNQDRTEGNSEKADAYNSKFVKNNGNSRNSNEENFQRNVYENGNGRSNEKSKNSEKNKNSNNYTPKPQNVYLEREKSANGNFRSDRHSQKSTNRKENSATLLEQQSQTKVSNKPDNFRHKVSNSVANFNKANSGKFQNDQNQHTREDSSGSQRHKQTDNQGDDDDGDDDEVKKAESSPVLETQFQIVRPKPHTQTPINLRQGSESKSGKEKSTGSNNIFQNSQTRTNVGSPHQLSNFRQGSQNQPNGFSEISHQQTHGYQHKPQNRSNGYAIGSEKQADDSVNQNAHSKNDLSVSALTQDNKKTTEKDFASKQTPGSYNEPKSTNLVKGMPKGGKNKKKAWYDKADTGSTADQSKNDDKKSRFDSNGDDTRKPELKKGNPKNDDVNNGAGSNVKGNLKDTDEETRITHKRLNLRNLSEKNERSSSEDEKIPYPKNVLRPSFSPNAARQLFSEPKPREELPHMRYNVNDMRYPKPFRRSQNLEDVLRESDEGSDLKKDDNSHSKSKGDKSGSNGDALEYDDTEEPGDDVSEDEESSRKISTWKNGRKQGANGEFEKAVTVQAEPYHVAEITKDSTTEKTVGGGNIYFYVKKGEEPSSITHTAVDAENAKKADAAEAAKDETLANSNSDLKEKEATKDQPGNEKPQAQEKLTDNLNDGVKEQEPDDVLHVKGVDPTNSYNGDQVESPENIPTTVRQMPLDVSKLDHEETKGAVDSEKSADGSPESDAERD